MYTTVSGTYKDGKVIFDEDISIKESPVMMTFLHDDRHSSIWSAHLLPDSMITEQMRSEVEEARKTPKEHLLRC